MADAPTVNQQRDNASSYQQQPYRGEPIPENTVELQHEMIRPDRSHMQSNYQQSVIKDVNLGNFDEYDQRILMGYQSLEETCIAWGLDKDPYNLAAFFNVHKQVYVMSTRALSEKGGFATKNLNVLRQVSEVTSRSIQPQAPRNPGIMDKLRPQQNDYYSYGGSP